MVIWKKILAAVAISFTCVPLMAQDADEKLQAQMQEAERRLVQQEEETARSTRELEEEMARSGDQLARGSMAQRQKVEIAAEEYRFRMKEAEQRMAEAARQMADLSMRQLPSVERLERIIRSNRGPVLGVNIDGNTSDDPVEGVGIIGVTPGGAADDAGLQAGDVMTSINGETLTADNGRQATDALLEFMQGVEEGDELDIEYLRNGKSEKVTLTPRPIEEHVFAFQFDGENFTAPDAHEFGAHVAPGFGRSGPYVWALHSDGFGDMEMVKLTDRLGSYFGTTEGLLVVRAPKNEDLKLEDGDVILNIDGRTPNSVSHALRILGSYQGGEGLEIEIMRDKRKRKIDITIEVEIRENQRSWMRPPVAPAPVVAPKTVIVGSAERT